MRTYVLISGDFTTWGGMDRANYELAWHLAERAGSTVHLVAHHVASPLCEHPNVRWRQVLRPIGSHSLGAPLLAWTGRRVARELARGGARVVVNGGNCDWTDVNWVHAVHAAWDRRDAHRPTMMRLRSGWSKRRSRLTEKRAVGRAGTVVTNSGRAREQIVETLGVARSRVRVVYYGVDATAIKPATIERQRECRAQLGLPMERPMVVFIGALGHDRNKGFDVLFSAWERLCALPQWDVDLVVAGDGAEVELWRQRSVACGLNGRIHFRGLVKNIPDLLGACDALVSPTHYDAYGLGVHEALCCGLPAFVTRCAGVAERYPAELSELLLNDPPDVEDIARRLLRWRADMLGNAARVAPFACILRQRSWKDMAEEIVGLLETTADDGRGA